MRYEDYIGKLKQPTTAPDFSRLYNSVLKKKDYHQPQIMLAISFAAVCLLIGVISYNQAGNQLAMQNDISVAGVLAPEATGNMVMDYVFSGEGGYQ